MLAFLVVDRVHNAAAWAAARGWTQLAANRFATPARDDIRVAERMAELVAIPGGIPMIRGPGFDNNPQADEFEALVDAGGARWVSDVVDV